MAKKTSVIDRFYREARKAVTSAELFVSKFMLDLLVSKIRLVCREYRIHQPVLKVVFDPESEVTACTSLDEMFINAGNKSFDGDDEYRFLKVAGVLLHELGHILFTNFAAWLSWADAITHGTFYPKDPEVEPKFEDAKAKVLAMAQDDVLRDAFLHIAHDLNNCVEDGREEGLLIRLIKNVRFMLRGLVMLRQEIWAEAPAFEDMDDWNELSALLQMSLHYARFKEIKGNFDPKSEQGEIFCRMIPQLDAYLDGKDAISCYDAFNKLIIYLADTIEQEFEKAKQEAQNQQGQSGEQQGQSGSESSSSVGNHGQCQVGSSMDSGSSSGGQSDSQTGASQSGGSKSSESSSSEQASGQQSSSEQSEQQKQDAKAAADKKASEITDKVVGKSVDNSESMGEKAKGSDRPTVGRRLSGLAKNGDSELGGTAVGADAAQGSGTISHEAASDETNVDLTIEDIYRKIADSKAEEAMSSAIKSEYSSVASEVMDYNEIHRNCDITMYHYSEASEADKAAYDKIASAISPLVKKAVKGSNFYKKDRRAHEEDRLYFGQRFNADQVYRADGRVFSKRFDHDEPPQVALAVRIDCSGSMRGDRMLAAQRCCVFLYEYVLGMEKQYNVKIPLYIYGDCVDRDAYGVNMYVFADDKYRTPTEKYRIMKMGAGGCNRDGLPLRMAVKRLEKEYPQAQKVVFNITDGRPNDSGYGGEPAYGDLRDLTRYCERKRIALASCAIGNDRDVIEEIYGTNHFLNISDLDELPVRLVRILKKLLK